MEIKVILNPKCLLNNPIHSYRSRQAFYCAFGGLAITDRHAIIGGMDYEDTRFAHVYFREL